MAPSLQVDSFTTEFILFLSVDIIDSSLHKKTIASEDYTCYKDFKYFFTFFTTHIASSADAIEVWKFLGDEIIFTSTLKSYNDILKYTQYFQKVLVTFNKDTSRKIKCKGTIWLANLPVYNMRIAPIPDKDPDYIGPSIDAGFRLSSFSDERKLVVSVDVVYAIHTTSDAQRHDDPKIPKFKTCYDGVSKLKGVYNNELYPIFWIDNYPENTKYDMLNSLPSDTVWESKNIIKACGNYIKQDNFMCIPFFNQEEEQQHKPSNYDKRRDNAVDAMKETDTEDGESQERTTEKEPPVNLISLIP